MKLRQTAFRANAGRQQARTRATRLGSARAAAAAALAAGLAACGGGGGSGGAMPTSQTASQSAGGYVDTALVSDGAVAASHTDATLQNAWGLAFAPGGAFWVADNNDSLATSYDGSGAASDLVVSIPDGSNGPANPSGEVYNATAGFLITSGGASAPAVFLFDGEGGTISGWNGGTSAVIAYDDGAVNGANAAVYKGLALASSGGASYLYATDLHNAKIDVFDATFGKVSGPGGLFAGKFADPAIPAGFAPFGITLLDGELFVTYAMQNAAADDEVTGAGLGYVDVFDTAGNVLQRFASGGALNAPWGIAIAPAGFGPAAGQVLIGNFGDGKINRFAMSGGAGLGALSTTGGTPLAIPGLWALLPGAGALNAAAGDLYYTAGPDNQTDGIFGRISYTADSGSMSNYRDEASAANAGK
jgi:uncharacterized protein (TIGR03118 family)